MSDGRRDSSERESGRVSDLAILLLSVSLCAQMTAILNDQDDDQNRLHDDEGANRVLNIVDGFGRRLSEGRYWRCKPDERGECVGPLKRCSVAHVGLCPKGMSDAAAHRS